MSGFTAGIEYISIDGNVINTVGSVTYNPGGTSRETQKGLDGVHGPKKTTDGPQIKVQMRDSGSFSLTNYNAQDFHTIYVGCANGKQLAGSNMWQVGTPEGNIDDGTINLQLEGYNGAVTESTV